MAELIPGKTETVLVPTKTVTVAKGMAEMMWALAGDSYILCVVASQVLNPWVVHPQRHDGT